MTTVCESRHTSGIKAIVQTHRQTERHIFYNKTETYQTTSLSDKASKKNNHEDPIQLSARTQLVKAAGWEFRCQPKMKSAAELFIKHVQSHPAVFPEVDPIKTGGHRLCRNCSNRWSMSMRRPDTFPAPWYACEMCLVEIMHAKYTRMILFTNSPFGRGHKDKHSRTTKLLHQPRETDNDTGNMGRLGNGEPAVHKRPSRYTSSHLWTWMVQHSSIC